MLRPLVLGTLFSTFAGATLAWAAPTRYEYQGPSFTYGTSPVAGLTHISGYFVLADAIGPNSFFHAEGDRPDLDPGPIDLWFTDGVTVVSGLPGGWGFWIETDGSGAFSGWQVALGSSGPLTPGAFHSMTVDHLFPGLGNDTSRYCFTHDCISVGGAGVSTVGNPGVWTASPVPVPAALWLFGSALGVMGWMRRKAAT